MASACTVKGQPASSEQVANMTLCCQIGKGMGATSDQLAGAIATMIQESACINVQGGDRDSAGLYQQRPSAGWGTYAQVTTPGFAIGSFMRPYLAYCQKGMSPIAASNAVQRSAYPTAPAQWLQESQQNVQAITGSSDFTDATMSGGLSATITRAEPYEFSRGSATGKETSWDCMGRLAQEVGWLRYMAGGELWFVSETWLANQRPAFAFAAGARGVLSIGFEADTRKNVAQMTVQAIAKRWSVLPGDLVTVTGQGPADGKWLVSDTRRTIANPTTEITLTRPAPPLPEPAPQTSQQTITVGGITTGGLGNAPTKAQQFYAACKAISDQGYPYVWGGGHPVVGTPNGGGYDCSGSVCAALGAAELGYRIGGPSDVSGTIAANWGQPGNGKWFTVWASSEHVWVQFFHAPAWRFDTSPWNSGPDGARLRTGSRSTSTFTPKSWPGL
jgi:hypothetical protein